MVKIDLNADLGEQIHSDLDEAIMPFISSCNIASGGHAGNEETILRTIQLANEHGVSIGIHPSFPDKENFGRALVNISDQALTETLTEQIHLVKNVAEQKGATVTHVKPHGALYNLSARDERCASILAETIWKMAPNLRLFGLAHSISELKAKEFGLQFIGEAFADRRYKNRQALMSRKVEGAVLSNVEDVLTQVEDLVFNEQIKTAEGTYPLQADTICLHSDTEGAVFLAKSIHQFIVSKGGHISSV